jgi:hypothetical protein
LLRLSVAEIVNEDDAVEVVVEDMTTIAMGVTATDVQKFCK